MDTLPSTWDNPAICFAHFMSLSEHEKTKIMDDCGDGFKENVAVQFGTTRRLRHRFFFVVVTCWREQVCRIREGPCAVSKLY